MEPFPVSGFSSITSTVCCTHGADCVHTLSTESEREHQLEKLEFALAVAISEGRDEAADGLISQIESFGDCGEEPGT